MAVRVLGKSPGTTALCVLSIALGIGLTTGLFSVGDAMLLRPLPLERPGEIYEVASRADDGQIVFYGWPDYLDMRRSVEGQLELVAYQRRGGMLARGEESEEVFVIPATANYFALLGVKAVLGRASVEAGGSLPATVLGHRLWQRRFGGDTHIVGKAIVLNGRQFVVTGVMPAEFMSLDRGVVCDIWLSMDAWFDVLGQDERQGRNGQIELVGRLKPDVNTEGIAAQLDAAIRGQGKHKPAPAGTRGTWLERSFAPDWKSQLFGGGGLLLALGLVLFVACANVAQLRLAQGEIRRKELGIRMALGASPWRVTRLLLVETALVSLAGAGLGVPLTRLVMNKASEFIAAGRAWMDYNVGLNERVLVFTLAACAASVLLAGLAPARHSVRLNVSEVLKSEQGVTGTRRGWQKQAFIVAQMAVSVMLFGLAATFLASFRNASAVRPGLDPDKKLLVMSVGPGSRLAAATWCEQVCERLSALPGVRGATFARRLPLADSGGGARVRVEIPGSAPLGVGYNNVGGNYFSLMGTRVLAGRAIDTNDRKGTELVMVISQLLARQVFGSRNPVGHWISVDGKARQVVGVAEDGPSNYLHEPPVPHIYLPFAQAESDDITLMVETAVNPATLMQAARREVKRFDRGATVYSSITLRQHMDQALSQDRTMATMATGLGIFGFLLTAAGLFGVVQYAVNRRMPEFGLRVALGAQRSEIQKIVLRDALRLAAWGIPGGLFLLGTASWYVQSLVLGVSPLDPLTYAASVVAAVLVTLAAAWLPARRATQVDPMAALRAN